MTAGSTPAPAGAPVGLIAGGGGLPIEIVAGARRRGRRVVCIDVQNADPRLPGLAEAYYPVAIGELGSILEVLRRHGVREVLLAGKVDKLAALRSPRLDAQGAAVARRLADLRDATILTMLTTVLEEAGFEVGNQTQYVSHLVPGPGCLGRRAPSSEEAQDIALGLRIAREIAALDVGQAVAVRRGVVLAVEASEGTDAMIRRAGGLASGVVIAKVSRPHQDPRYDLPVVGAQTVDALADSGGAALAVEAGRTILLDRDRLISAADAAEIAVVSVELP